MMLKIRRAASFSFSILAIAVIASLFTTSQQARGAVTRVGNGDDGSDLEGGQLVTSGILIETRAKAVARLKALDVRSIEHLGILLPELEKSEIYLVPRAIAPKISEDMGPESGGDGKAVFARTFAEPHAATRFFLSAMTLNEEQLIALHIHEALHRSLPPPIRENEAAVTKITLALAAPDATRDRVEAAITSVMPGGDDYVGRSKGEKIGSFSDIGSEFRKPKNLGSTITYSYETFFAPDSNQIHKPIESLNALSTELYPFEKYPIGFGLSLSYIHDSDESFMGPTGISIRGRIATVGGYEFGAFAVHSMYTAGNNDLQNSALGRDLTTGGISLRRETKDYYLEDDLSYTAESDAQQIMNGATYSYHYGGVTAVTVRAGAKIRKFELGLFGEAVLADAYNVTGPNYTYNSGRYRIIGAGPEAAYTYDNFRFALSARWVIDSTAGLRFDDLGDLMGWGLGQGALSSSISLRF
jgi:hypothetical protein